MNEREALRLALEALGHFEKAGLATLKTIDAITAIKQALEQPEQKPVSYETVYDTIIEWDETDGKRSRRELTRRIVALYTSPPKREWHGLTDVDVSKILDEQNGFYTFEKCFNFAKAIEAKLKEKNT